MKKLFKKTAGVLYSAMMFLLGKAPARAIPEGANVVSPAHGKVIEIRRVENLDIVFQKKGVTNRVIIPELIFPATLVMIEMTPLDVHVQRAPISGTVMRLDHYRGRHVSAMGRHVLEIADENEKVVALFANEREKVVAIQVAGVAARRIRNIAEVGDEYEKGDIYGRIKFGSQVVVLIPLPRKVIVNVGNRTVDGETVLAI